MKKNSILLYPAVLIFLIFFLLINSCKKKEDNTNTLNLLVPVLTTSTIQGITQNYASSGGNITSKGASNVITRGVCWSRTNPPTIADSLTSDGSGMGSFSSYIDGLTPNTTYFVRAYAVNSAGTGYGNVVSFKTLIGLLPELKTTNICYLTQSTAKAGGEISSDGGLAITSRGVCWSTQPGPTIANSKTDDGTGIGSFISILTGLGFNTSYYVRGYATNGVGTGYGNEIHFTFGMNIPGPQVTDIDGNIYNSVIIGTQVWMAQNLKVKHYRNGDTLTTETDDIIWCNLTTGAWCNYENNETNALTYGLLYNWYTVNDSRNICPSGWHVPSDAEWSILTSYLGGDSLAGGKLKESGTLHWNAPNTDATNESGFTALPAGTRFFMACYFDALNRRTEWWTSTPGGGYVGMALIRILTYDSSGLPTDVGAWEYSGESVRCVKDQ